VSLPDGWRDLEKDLRAARFGWPGSAEVIAGWFNDDVRASVLLHADGVVRVNPWGGGDPVMPVELLPHVEGAWVNHQRSRAP